MLTTVRAVRAGMCALIGVVALAGSASADTVNFEYTGAAQDWTVPYGVSSATFELSGAQGRGFPGVGSRFQGGSGGWSRATIAVTPASTVRVMVGGTGAGNAEGFNGGGHNGGGGATDVRIGGTALTDRVLVAGGGGGTGGCVGANAQSFGGAGGGVTGWGGTDPECGGSPGSGATQSAGGSNGGSLGQGGPGSSSGSSSMGGGGGGGYYGGGGGGSGGPGGGGSSFGPPGYLTSAGGHTGNGVVTITYDVTQRQTLLASAVGEGDGYVSSSPAGIDCGFEDDAEHDVCFYEFGQDQPVTVTAHPAPGTVFDQWIAGCTGSTQPTCNTTMSQQRIVSARFKHGPRALSVSKSGNGSGSVASAPAGIDCGANCSADYVYGTSVTLTATPETGSDFTGWTGACTGTSATCTVTMDQVQDVDARFTLKQFRLSLAKFENGSGTVVSSPAGIDCGPSCDSAEATFDYGTDVTLTATGATGSDFTDWGGICQPVDPDQDCVISMTQDRYAEVEFVLQRHALDVAKTGNGTGSVTSTPAGIDCGADCTNLYDHGTLVTLTAAPGEHSVFTGWSGPCSGTTATCTVTIDQAREVEAAFALEKRTLSAATAGNGSGSVSSQPAGIGCGPNCGAEFDYGTSVTLTAAPATDSDFTGWTGACTGAAATCTVAMDQARTVAATFTLQKRALTINTTGNGAGTVTPAPAGAPTAAATEFDYGTSVTLTATPAAGSDFTGWTGACTGATATCTVTMDQARTVAATFTLQQRTLTIAKAGNGSGTVTPAPAGAGTEHDYGTTVTLTATPATGSDFTGWTGACTGATSTCTVTMDQAHTVEATFTLQKRTLTINRSGNGSGTITPTPAGTDFDYGTTVTLTATPATGSDFTGWTGACTGRAATCTVTMNQAHTVEARFADRRPTITKLKVLRSKRPRGATRVSVTVSEAATVRFRLTRRSTKALTFDRKLTKAGTSTFTLAPKVRKQLKPGRYTLTAVATDSAGQRSAAKRIRGRLVK